MQQYASPTQEVPTPATITTADGKVWTYSPSPFEGEFARTYTCGKRRATLMRYRNSAQVRFLSTSGKSLEVVA